MALIITICVVAFISGFWVAIWVKRHPKATFHEPNVKISNLPKGTISTAGQAQFYEPISQKEKWDKANKITDLLE